MLSPSLPPNPYQNSIVTGSVLAGVSEAAVVSAAGADDSVLSVEMLGIASLFF
jgi:hypothetical protein